MRQGFAINKGKDMCCLEVVRVEGSRAARGKKLLPWKNAANGFDC